MCMSLAVALDMTVMENVPHRDLSWRRDQCTNP